MKRYLDYILVIFIWILIFGKLIFSKLFLLDSIPHIFFDTAKILELNNFKNIWLLWELLKLLLLQLNIAHLSFQIGILISIFVSYHYIKKISNHHVIFTLIFIFNPFTYSRIMTGQVGIVISYFLIPMYLYYLFEMFKSDFRRKDIFKAVIAYSIASSASQQFFAFNFILFALMSFLSYFFNGSSRDIKRYVKSSLVFVLLLVLLNSYWLQGFLSSDPVFESMDSSDQDLFSPKLTQGLPAVAKIMGMWGFWRESGYLTTYGIFPLWIWYLLMFMFVITMLIGYYINPSRESKFFLFSWGLGLILATGVSHPYTAGIFNFLFNNLPFFSGFRDSHKFVIFICLAYAYLCPAGVFWIRDELKSRLRFKALIGYLIPVLFAGLVILYTYPLAGLGGQVNPVDYPSSYYHTRDFLGQQELSGKIIYFPWDAYITYNWTKQASPDGRIAVPINYITEHTVLVSPGQWGLENTYKHDIKECLEQKDAGCLEEIGVQYMLVDNCPIFKFNSSWINRTKVHEDSCVDIYELDNKKTDKNQPPLRFIVGSIVSSAMLILLIWLIS